MIENTEIHWHTLSVDELSRQLNVVPDAGLAPEEVIRRQQQYGQNALQERRARPPWRMLLDQFTDVMILVLIAAAIISGFVGDLIDTVAIVVIIILNALIGFIQEYRAEQAVAALRRLAAPSSRVRRGNTIQTVAGDDIVPGDIVLLEAGNIIPADIRFSQSAQVRVDEASLTGESVPIEKRTEPISDVSAVIGDRRNMGYKGTLLTNGRGEGIVVATGMHTELGKIADLLQGVEETKTPLQVRLARFGKRLAFSVLAICLVIFITGILRGEEWMLMLLTAISLAVAAIPEALPAVVTISLALGAKRMVQKKALIRHLPAVETLGSITYICTDKTGTLTQNIMRAEKFFVDARLVDGIPEEVQANAPWHLFTLGLALSNDVEIDQDGHSIGDPTEVALVEAAKTVLYKKRELIQSWPRVAELAFDSQRKCMTTIHRNGQEIIAYSKGSPEAILDRADAMLTVNGRVALQRDAILKQAEALAAEGARVLAVAYRPWPTMPANLTHGALETQLVFLGLIAIADPPRPEAENAVKECIQAGITPVMITGDHPATAMAIARRLGIAGNDDIVITGKDLASMPDVDLVKNIRSIRVYARVSPEQKIRIVEALRRVNEFVAMTGDGVNDAPALKQAHIGVAMGKKGTDVAREASDMVLLDDNFATIVGAVKEGRRIYDNIRKFIKYGMTGNSGEIWTLFLAPFVGLPIPLLPIHILWVNLVTDGLPGLALAVEPAEKGIMQRRPRPPNESVFAHGMWQHIFWIGLLIGGLTLTAQAISYYTGSEHWHTMAFTVLTFSQLVHVLAIRVETDSLFVAGLLSNLRLVAAVTFTVLLQLAIIYVPWLQEIFKTHALSGEELLICVGLSSVVFVAVEIEKYFIRRGWLYREAGV